jgi:hypothetical protein
MWLIFANHGNGTPMINLPNNKPSWVEMKVVHLWTAVVVGVLLLGFPNIWHFLWFSI